VKRLKTRRLVLSLFAAAATSLTVVAIALGDDISNNLDGSIDANVETLATSAGAAPSSVGLYVQPRNSDGNTGCNFQGTTEAATFSVQSSNPLVATASSPVTFNNCGDTPSITVTPLSAGRPRTTQAARSTRLPRRSR
jgi:hypothetical protein